MQSHQDSVNGAVARGRSPWIATGAAAVGAAVIAGVLIASSGGGSGQALPTGGKPPGMPTLPGSTKAPTKLPTGAPTAGSSKGATATAKNDWNTAAGDKSVFKAEAWFPAVGDFAAGGRSYKVLDKDDRSCGVAEPKMRSLMSATCVEIIRSLWTNSAKTHVGSLSVVSLRDDAAARSLQNELTAKKSDGDYVTFITPPSSSGVRFNAQASSWSGTSVSGHYLVIVEVVRSDGAAADTVARDMVDDLRDVAKSHMDTVKNGA